MEQFKWTSVWAFFWKLLRGTLFCEALSELSKRNSVWEFFWELFRGTSVWEPFWETFKGKFGNYFGNHLKGLQFGTYFRNYSKRLLFRNCLGTI